MRPVQAAGTSLTGIFGVGPVIAAAVVGDVRDVSRFPSRDHFASYNGTAPIEVSSGGRKIYSLSRRGNRQLNHAIHMAAVTQIRHRHGNGRAYYEKKLAEKKLAEGKTGKEALRALNARSATPSTPRCRPTPPAQQPCPHPMSPGGQRGNGSSASVAGSQPQRRIFGQATPGPATSLRPRQPRRPIPLLPFPAPPPPRASGQAGPGPGAARPRSGARRASLTRLPASRESPAAGKGRQPIRCRATAPSSRTVTRPLDKRTQRRSIRSVFAGGVMAALRTPNCDHAPRLPARVVASSALSGR